MLHAGSAMARSPFPDLQDTSKPSHSSPWSPLRNAAWDTIGHTRFGEVVTMRMRVSPELVALLPPLAQALAEQGQ